MENGQVNEAVASCLGTQASLLTPSYLPLIRGSVPSLAFPRTLRIFLSLQFMPTVSVGPEHGEESGDCFRLEGLDAELM